MKGHRNAALLQHIRTVSGNVSRAMIYNQPNALQCYSNRRIQPSKKQVHRSQAPLYHNKKRKRPAATAAKKRMLASSGRLQHYDGKKLAGTLWTETAGAINSEISAEQQQSTIGQADEQQWQVTKSHALEPQLQA